MNIRQILLALSGKIVSLKKIQELEKEAEGDKQVKEKLGKVIKLARANKLNQFKFVVEGAFKALLSGHKKSGGKIVPFKKDDFAGLDGIDGFTLSQAQELGIVDGLGRLNHKDIYKSINEQILENLKKGDLKWRKAWKDGVKIKGVTYGPQNYVSQSPYRGFNAFSIALFNMVQQKDHTYFLTKKQIQDRGGKLKDNASGVVVAAYIKSEKETPHPENPSLVNVEIKTGVVSYVVYPIDHTTGVKPIKRKNVSPEDKTDIKDVLVKPQTIIDNMPKAPAIKNGGDRAFYTSAGDYVQMPLKKAFDGINEYYSTLFHELVHSTGHEKRIGRKFGKKFGDKDYAFEELIAELGAAYLCGVSGIEYYTLDNTSAYLKSWGSALASEMKQDKTFFFRAIMGATKAAKYIIGETQVDTIEPKGKKKASKPVKKTPEVKPDKTKKASIQAAVNDVITLKKFSGVPDSYATLLYNSFKKKKSVPEDSLSQIQLSMFSKLGDKFKLVTYSDDSQDWEFVPTSLGREMINAIEGRQHTLRAKKQGNDMFPELAGVKSKTHMVDGQKFTDQELIDYVNETYYYEMQDAGEDEVTTVGAAKRILKAWGETVERNIPKSKKKGLNGVMSVSQAANTKFDLLGLDGQYLGMIGEACKPTSFFMYGPGGSGKSTFTLKFAYYLAQKGNKIAYIAGEQFATPVLSKMLQRLGIQDIPNFVIAKNLNSIDPKQFDVIVIDSKDSLELDHVTFQKLQDKYPAQSWAILSQATKDGGFTGSEKWRNLVDTMIYCEGGIAQTGIDKNRWGGKGQVKVY